MKRLTQAIWQCHKKKGKVYERSVIGQFNYWCKEMIRLGLEHPNLQPAET